MCFRVEAPAADCGNLKEGATRVKKKFGVFPFVNAIILCALALLCLYPMLYVLFASLSHPDLLMKHRGMLFAPLGFTLQGYELTFKNPNILSSYANTLFYVGAGTVLNVVVTAMAAYALSRKNLMLGRGIMLIILFTMYFSGGLIPLYLLIIDLGLYDSRMSVILVGLVSTWNLVVMRTAFEGVPESLEESAKIDGAGPMRIMTNIYLPVTLPMIATITLFYAVGHWNAWFHHMVFLKSRGKYPLQLILREILITNEMSSMTKMVDIGSYSSDRYKLLVRYSTIIIATLPILTVYPFAQRFFVKGVMIGAIKG